MHSPTVYLAGPISGLTYEEATEWRERATDELTAMGYTVRDPMRGKEHLKGVGAIAATTKAKADIYKRDVYDVDSADIILASLVRPPNGVPSVGTMVEIGYAAKGGKLIIVMTDDPYLRTHPFIEGPSVAVVGHIKDALQILYELRPVEAGVVTRNGVIPVMEDWVDVEQAPYQVGAVLKPLPEGLFNG